MTGLIDSIAARRILLSAAVLALLAACAPKWEPSPGYRGGFLTREGAPRIVTVGQGDSVYAISRRYNVSMKSIIERNGLMPPYILVAGQRLVLDAPLVHAVQRGDTLYAISRRYGVDMHALASRNGLREPYTIYPGQQLFITEAYTTTASVSRVPQSSEPAVSSSPSSSPTVSAARPSPVRVRPPATVPSAPPAPPARSGSQFIWPVDGQVISAYGSAGKGLHNDGINISVPIGTSVKAAENGVVAYSGNELQGFGNLLLLKHADGWMTAYAHNDTLMVKRGDEVARGQVIARSGRSGNVTSPQLHFEIRRGTKAVDPVGYLERPRG